MASRSPIGTGSVEIGRLNLPEALLALGQFAARRAQRLATLANEITTSRKRPSELIVEALDGNEADLEELTLRWRLSGVRWPIIILLLLFFLVGVNAGRRARR